MKRHTRTPMEYAYITPRGLARTVSAGNIETAWDIAARKHKILVMYSRAGGAWLPTASGLPSRHPEEDSKAKADRLFAQAQRPPMEEASVTPVERATTSATYSRERGEELRCPAPVEPDGNGWVLKGTTAVGGVDYGRLFWTWERDGNAT